MSGYEGTGSVNLSDTLYVDEFIQTDLKLQICTDSTYPLDKQIKLFVLHLCLCFILLRCLEWFYSTSPTYR